MKLAIPSFEQRRADAEEDTEAWKDIEDRQVRHIGDHLEESPDGGDGEYKAYAPKQTLLKDGAQEFVCLLFEVKASDCDHGNEWNCRQNCYHNSEWTARMIMSKNLDREVEQADVQGRCNEIAHVVTPRSLIVGKAVHVRFLLLSVYLFRYVR